MNTATAHYKPTQTERRKTKLDRRYARKLRVRRLASANTTKGANR